MPTSVKEAQDLGKRLAEVLDRPALPSQGASAGTNTTIHVVHGDVNIYGAPPPVLQTVKPNREAPT